MKNKSLLSVCIPTYNRSSFLRECLFRIFSAMKDGVTSDSVTIIISDNASTDDTREVVESFQKKYQNIQYYRNKENIGGDRNVIQVASYAKTLYIWFFSDDDILEKGALKTMLHVIREHHPSAIICNLNLADKNGKIIEKNLLLQSSDVLLKTKKEVFTYLEHTFFLPFDWHVTCLSNTIVSKKLFDEQYKTVMNVFDTQSSNFLHSGIIYYNSVDHPLYIISKPLVRFRSENRSFGPDEKARKKEYLSFLHSLLKRHYQYICQVNKSNISLKFRLLIALKNWSRDIQYFIVKTLRIDISSLLIFIFEKK